VEKYGSIEPDMAIGRMLIACLKTKATNTQAEYVIHIALPQLQWLGERALVYVTPKRPVLFTSKCTLKCNFVYRIRGVQSSQC
jgi:hypothetical protein